MPKRVKDKDANELAHDLVRGIVERTEEATGPGAPVSPELREYLRELGRRGGQVSGARRMTNLTGEQRREIAARAARARWKRRKKLSRTGRWPKG